MFVSKLVLEWYDILRRDVSKIYIYIYGTTRVFGTQVIIIVKKNNVNVIIIVVQYNIISGINNRNTLVMVTSKKI